MALALTSIRDSVLEEGTKGLPRAAAGLAHGELGAQGWNLLREDMPMPLAVLKQQALLHNARWMQSFMAASGVELSPHGKTTMCPQLFDLQLEHDAWGITVASIAQLKVCSRFGVKRVLMANQLVGRNDIAYVADLLDENDIEFYCLVDSISGVDRLQSILSSRAVQRPLNVLVEVGIEGGRTGCRSEQEALGVAKYVLSQTCLTLAGVECYEGIIVTDDSDEDTRLVTEFIARVVNVYRECERRKLFSQAKSILISAGGSAYFDIVAGLFGRQQDERDDEILNKDGISVHAVVRSGCYLTHDSLFYKKMLDRVTLRNTDMLPSGQSLQPALEVWAYVQSLPESGLAILTVGKRDISFDIDLPTVEQWFRPGEMSSPQATGDDMELFQLSDHHAFLHIPEDSELQVGDMISLGISHPCTTFDKWQLLYVVDEDYNITEGLKTFF